MFFHVSDVIENNQPEGIKSGDDVEFQVSHNSRNGKLSAIKIKRITSSTSAVNGTAPGTQEQSEQDAKRPERINIKLKVANIDNESGKQLILTRGPFNPDGKTKSFSKQLKERLPGLFSTNQLVNENSTIIQQQATGTTINNSDLSSNNCEN